MIVQCCLNGARPAGFHPRLPLTAAAIAEDGAAAVAAGAAELHLHIRGADGRETLAADAVDPVVAALRVRLPGTLFGLSTGDWIEGGGAATLAAIAAWRRLPDYASVNLAEDAAPAVIALLRRRGIGVEAGLDTAASAERFVRLGLATASFRILVEIDHQDLAAAHAEADRILAVLAAAAIDRPILLHGFDATVWPFAARARAAGFSTRVGLEDGATLPDGTPAADNAALVAAAVALYRRPAPARDGGFDPDHAPEPGASGSRSSAASSL